PPSPSTSARIRARATTRTRPCDAPTSPSSIGCGRTSSGSSAATSRSSRRERGGPDERLLLPTYYLPLRGLGAGRRLEDLVAAVVDQAVAHVEAHPAHAREPALHLDLRADREVDRDRQDPRGDLLGVGRLVAAAARLLDGLVDLRLVLR